VRDWVRIMEPEYERAGLKLTDFCPYDAAYFSREDEEYALADFHCAASSIVRDALVARGISAARIWTVPYGADVRLFHRGSGAPGGFRVLFAGQICLRKGIKTLLDALTLAGRAEWSAEFAGGDSKETARDVAAYRGAVPLRFRGAMPQADLAEAMRGCAVLVLPSLEEGFGLVVPQALNCGAPCIVSDRVGAKDLIRHRENGSIFPAGDAAALAREIAWWAENLRRVDETFGWTEPARRLIALSSAAT